MEKYDVIIIGAGPAGLTAGVYACRANLSVLILEAEVPGGKLYKTYEINNYPGILNIGGGELGEKLVEHATSLGAKLESGIVNKIEKEGDTFKVSLDNETTYESKTIIVATGTKERQLGLPHADEFVGRGISYCAVCDGFFYRKKIVTIIGGGNSALEEALYLANLADKVNIVIRRDVFRADQKVVDKVKENEKINIIVKHLPESLVIEDDTIKGIVLKNVDTGELQTVETNGIFPYIGADPITEFVPNEVLDEKGYIKTNSDMSTSVKGLYAAGDVIAKGLRQVVTACSDGAIAANSIVKYLDE